MNTGYWCWSAAYTPTSGMTCATSCTRFGRPVGGAPIVVLTNATGGLRPDLAIGQPVLISDHLNLTARSPLLVAQFVDLTDAYAHRLRQLAPPEPTRSFAGM